MNPIFKTRPILPDGTVDESKWLLTNFTMKAVEQLVTGMEESCRAIIARKNSRIAALEQRNTIMLNALQAIDSDSRYPSYDIAHLALSECAGVK